MNRNRIVRITIRWLALNVNPDPQNAGNPCRSDYYHYVLLKADYSGEVIQHLSTTGTCYKDLK
jgi:hypothetical protein